MPETIGPFRLLRIVGSDGSATVYDALDPEGKERLALTVLAPHAVSIDAGSYGKLCAAVRAAGQIRHPNLILPRDMGREGSCLFFAAPLVDGETLAQYTARAGRLPPMQALALLARLFGALDCAGRHRWVHSAIHPGHLHVARNGQLAIDGSGWVAAACTRRPGHFDSPHHLAPEVALGVQADPRADLYSAAVVAYQLLTGALPWDGDGQSGGPGPTGVRPVRSLRRELPAELDEVFGRALAHSPDARYASAAQLWSALHAVLGSPVWERQRAPARATASIAALPGDESRVRPPAITDPAVSDDAGFVTPLTGRAATALMVGCTAVALWTAGLWKLERVERPDERVIASQAMPAPLSTGNGLPAVQPMGSSPAPSPPPVTAKSTPATVRAQEEPQRPSARTHAGLGPAAADTDDHPGPASAAAARRMPQRARVRASNSPVREQLPMSKSASPDQQCQPRQGFAREMCIVLHCATAEFRPHPACVRLHREGEARLQLAASRGAP